MAHVVIQKSNGEFYAGGRQWTRFLHEAFDFGDLLCAAVFKMVFRLNGEIVLVPAWSETSSSFSGTKDTTSPS